MAVPNYTDEEFLNKYEERAKIHRLVPFQKIVDLLGNIKDKKILDLGCGTGDLSEILLKKNARVIGLDVSQKWIDLCKNRYKEKISDRFSFQLGTGTNLSFSENYFDGIAMNMVLLNVDTIEEVEDFFKNISRVLKKDGTLVFSDLHPIALMTPKVRNRSIKYIHDFSYFRNGDQFTAGIKEPDGKVIEFVDRHWTLETYSRLLEKYGLYITTIAEPTYDSDAPDYLQNYPIPEYILFKCKKVF